MVDLDFLGAIDPEDERQASLQIADLMRAAILTGRFAPGDRLPSQPEMATHFRVARETVKRALDILRAERLIMTRQGSGAFVRAQTQRPVELRPHLEAAFEQPFVSIDFAGYSSETLRDAIAEPLDQVRAGRLRPTTITIRLLLADMTHPLALPTAADSTDATPVRSRQERITRRAAGAIVDQVQELGELGLVQAASVALRTNDLPPVFKLYILNNAEVFFGYYTVTKRTITVDGNRVPVFDPMGKDTTLFNYRVDDDDASHGTQFVQSSRAWFESIWTTIARPYTP